jgi:hypothetical protein
LNLKRSKDNRDGHFIRWSPKVALQKSSHLLRMDAHSYISCPRLPWHFRLQRILVSVRGRAHIFLLELGSFLRRIRSESNKCGYVPISQILGTVPLENQLLNNEIRSSSDYRERVMGLKPWASLSDWSLYLEGWASANAWHHHTYQFGSEHSEQKK